MSKNELKELVLFIIISIVNIAIAYVITTILGIQNIILYKSLTAMQYTITYELLIWFALSFVESVIYHFKYEIQN